MMRWLNRIRKRQLLDALPLCAFILVLGVQVFVPPVAGLANNGDFGKVLGPFALAASTADEYGFAPLHYTFHPSHEVWFGFYSSEQLFAGTAIGLNMLLRQDGIFDLRVIGFVHAAVVIAAFVFLPGRTWIPWLAVLVFGDAMYATQLNSFYMDTAAYVFLAVAFVAYVRAWPVLFIAASCLMLLSKPQHALLGVPIAAALFFDRARFGLSKDLLRGTIACIPFVMYLSFSAAPPEYAGSNVFSVVFYRILPKSADPIGDLKMLGLDESFEKYKGMHAYSEGSPVNEESFQKDFGGRISYFDIGRFYMLHPGQAIEAVVESLGLAGRQRPAMGNFDRSYGQPAFAESASLAFWSAAKRRLFEGRGAVYLTFFTLLGLTTVLLSLASPLRVGVITLVAMGCVTLGITALGDAVETARHFLLFHAIEDLMLVSCAGLAGMRISLLLAGRRAAAARD